MADLFVYRGPAESSPTVVHSTEFRFMRLYCWPCKSTHEFGLKDVERIVYTLVLDSADAWDDAHAPDGIGPQCLQKVLEWANAAPKTGTYAEQVEQGIECRERSDG
jgi:hypothetical protein